MHSLAIVILKIFEASEKMRSYNIFLPCSLQFI